jgi:hypothetical protein
MTITRRTLENYLAVHNAGVVSGDFSEVVKLFTVDGELRFVGVELGPYKGHQQIAQAFRDYPPSDTLILRSVAADGNKATAVYARSSEPDKRVGTLVLTGDGANIQRLTISVQAR